MQSVDPIPITGSLPLTELINNARVNYQSIAISEEKEKPAYIFPGGVAGFIFYWLSLATPFIVYGPNTLFFLLYTWPFFLALMPVSVLIGIALAMLLRGQLWLTIAASGTVVSGLFWALFVYLSGW